MEVSITCPCPLCGFGIEINDSMDKVFETVKCPSCKASLVLKYDEIEEGGKEKPVWWFETVS